MQRHLTKPLDQAFKKVVKQVNVPGFRKGRVPRPIFEKRFGVEALYQDALISFYLKHIQKQLRKQELSQLINQKLILNKLEKGKL